MCLDRFSSICLVSGSWNRPKISRDTVGDIQGKVSEALNWSFMESEGLSTTGIWNVDMKLQYLLHFLVTKKSRFYNCIVIHLDHALNSSSQLRRSLHPLREPGLVAKLPSCKMFQIEQHEQNINMFQYFLSSKEMLRRMLILAIPLQETKITPVNLLKL